jgi:succinate-semialdehyde dehydrogenase / glutarate-semialdehyde dehydrogenase
MAYESINPATGEKLATFPEAGPDEIHVTLDRARGAFQAWRACTIEERAQLMRRVAEYLRDNKNHLAGLITDEMGKPIQESEGEIEKAAWTAEFYADRAAEFLQDVRVPTNARESVIAFEPLGVVFAVMPWNYPVWQVLRFAIPGLMAGNGAVVKHSPNCPQSALAVEEIFRACDFPDGLVSNLFLSNEDAARVIADPRIAAVTLTGSPRAGSAVASEAGAALKKSVMELGGSDPFIVLEDADLDGAAEFAVKSRFQNTGQSCIAAKRFLVVDSIADEFQSRFVEAVSQLKVGNPRNRDTQIGPLAREDLRDNLERQVRESEAMGAKVLTGGKPLDGPGFFYQPTVLAHVTTEMPVFREETFGPVAPIFRVRGAEEALALANDSQYGLGADLWTGDGQHGVEIARRIESGSVFINGMVFSDPRLPFGGTKRSGFGRELSTFGIHEFTNVQTIWVGPATGPQMQVAATAE